MSREAVAQHTVTDRDPAGLAAGAAPGGPLRVRVLDDPARVAKAAADLLAEAVAARPDLAVGLLTGRTAIPFYDELTRRHVAGEIDLSQVTVFNLDELLLPAEHPASFNSFMHRYAWERIGLDRSRCDIPVATADPEAECRRYDAALAAAGGLDLLYLGVGVDGHVGYNMPGAPQAGTHIVALPEELADSLEVPPTWRPLRAITMGLGTIRAARRIVLIATGELKAKAVHALVDGPEDPCWPCSLLRVHADLHVLLDREAAGR